MSNKFQSSSSYLRVPLLAATLATGMLAACGGTGDSAGPAKVQTRLQSTLPNLLDNTLVASEFLEESGQLAALGNSLETLTQITSPIFGDTPSTTGEIPLFAADEEGEEGGAELNPQEITDMLVEQIFNEANYQGDGNYAIPASLACANDDLSTPLPGDALPERPTLDPECVADMEAISPLIHVESAGDGLDFDLLIGPDKYNPLSLELRSSRISVVSDLGDAVRSAELIATLSGEELDLPQSVEGVVAASLEVHGPKDVSMSLAIRSAIAVAGDVDGEAVSVTLDASDPLLSVRVDAIAKEAIASVDLKRTQISMPMHLFEGDSIDDGFGDQTPDSRRLDIDWKGHSTTLTLNEAAQSFAFTNIGIGNGKSTLKLDGETFFAVELNADSGHAFDLDVADVAGALPIFAFTPEIDFEMFVDMRVVAEEGDEEVPAALAGTSYVVQIDGAAPSIQAIENSAEESAIKVVTGEMRISSSSASGDIQVTAGQCLIGSELLDGEHEILGYLEAGNCPN